MLDQGSFFNSETSCWEKNETDMEWSQAIYLTGTGNGKNNLITDTRHHQNDITHDPEGHVHPSKYSRSSSNPAEINTPGEIPHRRI